MAKKQFLYENVYNDLKQKIECGDLKPGDKLEVEEDMIAHYGVSAITVKKALNLLAEENGKALEEKLHTQGADRDAVGRFQQMRLNQQIKEYALVITGKIRDYSDRGTCSRSDF